MNTSTIREHMEILSSDGKRIGTVDRVEGEAIKLTRADAADGLHHYLPLKWVARVDTHVHLNKTCDDAKRNWQTSPAGACH